MAIADANYKIRYADAGYQGRISDGGVFTSTDFYSKVIDGKLNIPKPSVLPGISGVSITFILVADDAFSLSSRIMKYLTRVPTEKDQLKLSFE
ncbi:hypothetical protein ANN_23737 [Periplaneta americana]|uniref:Uncharacterized protein n=1 Tax=Periplaneta americana TaxID=6978 RepID=A0ABQ8SLW5_PERAM|nr:hypothetical protein ANN_23737 [Periplaneta americana]